MISCDYRDPAWYKNSEKGELCVVWVWRRWFMNRRGRRGKRRKKVFLEHQLQAERV